MFDIAQLNAVLRPLGTGQARADIAEVQPDHLREINLTGQRHAKQALGAEESLEGFNFGAAATRAAQVVNRFFIDREKAHGGTVLGRHVGQRGAVRHGQCARAFAKKFNKLAHHLFATQHLGHAQHQVGGGHPFTQAPADLKAHYVRREHVNRLAQHSGFRFDAAHAPADHTQTIDHGGVAVGANQRVGVVQRLGSAALDMHTAREVFEVDLVHDAKARRHHAKSVKGLHAPLEELVALAVALEFELHVQVHRVGAAVVIHHHRMVYHQVYRYQGLDAPRVPAQPFGGTAHGGQVRQQRHAGEILQQHARHHKGNLLRARCARLPLRELRHMRGRDFLPVTVAQHGLEHDAYRYRQTGDLRKLTRQRRQGIKTAPRPRRGLEAVDHMGKLRANCRQCGHDTSFV